MKKFSLIIFCFIILVGCGSGRNKGLEKSINEIVKDENNSEIHLAALTDFDWDKAFLFHPYYPHDRINSLLGVEFKNHKNIEMREDLYLLVFLYEDKVTQYAELIRDHTTFSIGENDFLIPSDDTIEIIRYER